MPCRSRDRVCLFTPVLVFFFVVVPYAFPLQATSATNHQSDTYNLEGTVIDSVSARPIARALVQLPPWPERAMLTDAQGEFLFERVPQGLVQILVTKPGFIYRGTTSTGNVPSPIQLGPETGKLVLKLTQAAVIYGRVITKDDQPLEGAWVEVLDAALTDGRRQSISVQRRVRSDAEGSFRIAGLAPGRYYIALRPGQASSNRWGLKAALATEAYPKLVYYPSSPDLDSAAPVDLLPAARAEMRFMVEPVPSFGLAGLIGDLGSWSQVDPPVLVDESGQVLLEPDAFSRQSGAFEFRMVPAGRYLMRLGATDRVGRHSFSLRRITVEASTADLRLSPSPGIDIAVVVRMEFGQPHALHCMNSAAGQKAASDCTEYPAARLELQSLDSASLRFYSEVGRGKIPPSLVVGGIVPGKYLVNAKATFGGYIQSVRCGDLDLLREPLLVSEGGAPPIEVVVRDDAATLNVHVRKDNPGQQVLVLAFSHPRRLAGPQMKASGGAAEFQSGPLPPGEYEVFAFDAADGVQYTNSDVLDRYTSQAAEVSVAAAGIASVTVGVVHIGE